MSTNTSIGPEGMKGGNEDHGNADGLGNKTLGEHSTQQPPAGAELPDPNAEAGRQQPDKARGKPTTDR